MEECTSKGLDGARKGGGVRESRVDAEDSDVFFSSPLLGLDETGRTVNTDNQTPSDFWVERSAVTSLLHAQDSSQPSDDFMRRWVRWFVQIYDARPGRRVSMHFSTINIIART